MPNRSPELLEGRNSRVVRIAGAGPAGLSAAIVLARRGFRVELHEARESVGSRWKRGLQVIENFSEKEDALSVFQKAGIATRFETRSVTALDLLHLHPGGGSHPGGGGGGRTRFTSQIPLGYYVRRGTSAGALDRSLLEEAREAGVQIFLNSPQSPQGDVRIFATGPRRVDGIGKEVTFETPLSDRMTVVLDPELAPGGYAYLFVVDGRATLGMAVLHRFREVDAYYEKTVAFFSDRESIEIRDGEVSYSYANFYLGGSREIAGRLYIGEAAGFQDYLFGFGIRFAMESGILAARSISENIPFDRLLSQKLGPKIEAGLANRFLYESTGNLVPRLLVALAGRSRDVRGFLRHFYKPGFGKTVLSKIALAAWRNRNLKQEKPLGVGDAAFESQLNRSV